MRVKRKSDIASPDPIRGTVKNNMKEYEKINNKD